MSRITRYLVTTDDETGGLITVQRFGAAGELVEVPFSEILRASTGGVEARCAEPVNPRTVPVAGRPDGTPPPDFPLCWPTHDSLFLRGHVPIGLPTLD